MNIPHRPQRSFLGTGKLAALVKVQFSTSGLLMTAYRLLMFKPGNRFCVRGAHSGDHCRTDCPPNLQSQPDQLVSKFSDPVWFCKISHLSGNRFWLCICCLLGPILQSALSKLSSPWLQEVHALLEELFDNTSKKRLLQICNISNTAHSFANIAVQPSMRCLPRHSSLKLLARKDTGLAAKTQSEHVWNRSTTWTIAACKSGSQLPHMKHHEPSWCIMKHPKLKSVTCSHSLQHAVMCGS